jgi:hypothetical protein
MMKYDGTFNIANALPAIHQRAVGMTRTIIWSDEPRIAPTQKEMNPNAKARSIEIVSTGVPRNDVTTATPSQIHSGNNWRSRGRSTDNDAAEVGGAYGFADD